MTIKFKCHMSVTDCQKALRMQKAIEVLGCQILVKDPSGSFTINTVSHCTFRFHFTVCTLYFNDTTEVLHNLIDSCYLNFLATWGHQKQAVNTTLTPQDILNIIILHIWQIQSRYKKNGSMFLLIC